MAVALTHSDLKGSLKLLSTGKVRDLYELDDATLLFVATDRISAYDVVMKNGVPSKGKVLTAISDFWFNYLSDVCPNHLITSDLAATGSKYIPDSAKPFAESQLQGRSMVVRKLEVLKVEAIVRGYITGSAWKEYKGKGTVHGIKVREGMQESEAFDKPIYTPSTKAEQGEHDENIHPDQAISILGEQNAKEVERLSLALYTKARDYALTRGIIIADTKFEFGVDTKTGKVVLADEVLTPDSSRFWPKDKYEVGKSQDSYDKQYLRDWLTREGLKNKQDVEMTEEVVKVTSDKYREAYKLLTGKEWSE